MRRTYSVVLELVAELDTRGAVLECGYRSLPELLKDVSRISRAEATRRVRHAHAVAEVVLISGGSLPAPLPRTGAALRNGEVAGEHLEVMVRTLSDLPAHITPAQRDAAEDSLVGAARQTDPRTLAIFAGQLRAHLDEDGPAPADLELAEPVNELRFVTRRNGRLTFTGELEPEAGALFRAMLSPLARPRPSAETGPDRRTLDQRHGDAMVDLLHLAASTGGLPREAGEKPHLVVTVALDHLRATSTTAADMGAPCNSTGRRVGPTRTGAEGRVSGGATLERVGAVDAASARRIACDCKVIPVVLGSNSEVLDLGRASHTVNQALRRALVLRDRGCAFPDCDRPHQWCHAHHIEHWADGGLTRPDNLLLLCGQHHRLVHHSPWECFIRDGIPWFRPPRYVDPDREPRANLLHRPRHTPHRPSSTRTGDERRLALRVREPVPPGELVPGRWPTRC